VTGIEVAVGFLVAWLAKKAKRVGDRLDHETDQALDAGLDRLHHVIAEKLHGDKVLIKLDREVSETGTATPRTQQRIRLALEDAVDEDPDFAARLAAIVQHLNGEHGRASALATGDNATAIAGDATICADRGSIAAWSVGTISLGGERPDPH
jgi:hypothetical protein